MNAKICHASLWRRGGFYARFYTVISEATRPSPSEARTWTRRKTSSLSCSRTSIWTRSIHAALQRDETYQEHQPPSEKIITNLRPAGRRKEEDSLEESRDVATTTEIDSNTSTKLDLRTLNRRLREVVSQMTRSSPENEGPHVVSLNVTSQIKELLRLSPYRDSVTYALLITQALYYRFNKPERRKADRFFRECETRQLTNHHVLMLRLFQLTQEERKQEAVLICQRLKTESEAAERLQSFVRILRTKSWNSESILQLYFSLRSITTLDASTYNTLLNYLLSGRHFKACDDVITDMIQYKIAPNVTMFNMLIRRFTALHDSKRAWRIYDALLSNDYIPDIKVATSLIVSCTATSEFKRAYDIFGSLSRLGIQPNPHAYSAILTAAAKAMDYLALQRYFDQMLVDKIAPTQFHYAALIQGCAFLNRFQDGWNMYLDMQSRGLKVDAHVGAHALLLCQRARRGRELQIVEQDLEEANITREDILQRKTRMILLRTARMLQKREATKIAKTSARKTAEKISSKSVKKPKDILKESPEPIEPPETLDSST